MRMVEEVEARNRRPRATRACVEGVAVGYLRCSTAEQADSGLGLAAQRQAVEEVAQRRGLHLHSVLADEGVSGSVEPARRPQLSQALQLLGREAGTLVVSRVDRLGRTLHDLVVLFKVAQEGGWSVISADGLLDTSTLWGRVMGIQMGIVAEIERELIRARTREALATKKARGDRLGRPIQTPEPLRRQVASVYVEQGSYLGAAEALNQRGITTVTGSTWTASKVSRTLASLRLDDEANSTRRS
ncbi:MAG: recombinase family protein [Actinomycetota bacterium]